MEDITKYQNERGDSLADHCIYVEPSDSSLNLPDTIGYLNDVVRFTGQFYEKKGFPKGYRSIEMPDKARVFRYTHYEIVQSNYRKRE